MCGRYVLNLTPEEIFERFGITEFVQLRLPPVMPRFNVAPMIKTGTPCRTGTRPRRSTLTRLHPPGRGSPACWATVQVIKTRAVRRTT